MCDKRSEPAIEECLVLMVLMRFGSMMELMGLGGCLWMKDRPTQGESGPLFQGTSDVFIEEREQTDLAGEKLALHYSKTGRSKGGFVLPLTIGNFYVKRLSLHFFLSLQLYPTNDISSIFQWHTVTQKSTKTLDS